MTAVREAQGAMRQAERDLQSTEENHQEVLAMFGSDDPWAEETPEVLASHRARDEAEQRIEAARVGLQQAIRDGLLAAFPPQVLAYQEAARTKAFRRCADLLEPYTVESGDAAGLYARCMAWMNADRFSATLAPVLSQLSNDLLAFDYAALTDTAQQEKAA
jgi:hypothetical protein